MNEIRTLSVSDARIELADLVNRVAYGNDRIVLTRQGHAVAALVSTEDLKILLAIDGLHHQYCKETMKS